MWLVGSDQIAVNMKHVRTTGGARQRQLKRQSAQLVGTVQFVQSSEQKFE